MLKFCSSIWMWTEILTMKRICTGKKLMWRHMCVLKEKMYNEIKGFIQIGML